MRDVPLGPIGRGLAALSRKEGYSNRGHFFGTCLTELRKFLCTWFGEVCSCCCLSLLPQLACIILATTYKEIFSALYKVNLECIYRSLRFIALLFACGCLMLFVLNARGFAGLGRMESNFEPIGMILLWRPHWEGSTKSNDKKLLYRARLNGRSQVWWMLLLLLLTTSAWPCLQHSYNLGTAF